MSAGIERPVAFYHRDGLVAAWNFAERYAGTSGHVATLPEIVELRLGARAGIKGSPWETWYTSSSAEYVGVGADGHVKIIVAHGVGPMSTIDGIKTAYKWEWGDKSRRNNGGRITAQQFLDLESGAYGETKIIAATDFIKSNGQMVRKYDIPAVSILDFQEYLDAMGLVDGYNIFYRYLTTPDALRDPLIRMRLGSNAYRYLMKHERIAKAFHVKERPNAGYRWAQGFDDRKHPYITKVETASNCAYTLPNEAIRKATGKWVDEPRVPEEGYALAHLLDIDAFMRTHTQEVGVMLISSPNVHEWWNGAKFIAMPDGVIMNDGLAQGPDPDRTIHEHWEHFMQPVEEGYAPIRPYLLKYAHDEWFACYPKKFPNDQCMDSGDVEFHVRSVRRLGDDGRFTTDEMFFLRYKLAQVQALMPKEANAYEIVDISGKDQNGLTTVTVRFYKADVDISRRLPRTDEIARDYERLMEVYAR
ncbi:MAG: hypothetical protein KDA17_01310 [Candidatus Saccharibacteria bacterium]|nr:hypothetical protein [Candidatus Saccharibacteria bacterium]